MRNLIILFYLLFIFYGCSSSYQYKYVSIEPSVLKNIKQDRVLEELGKRFQEYWDYYSAKIFEKSYNYELPYLKFLHPLKEYKLFNSSNRKGYKIVLKSIKMIDNNRAVINYIFKDKDNHKAYMKDYWVFVNKKWYHYLKFSKLPSIVTPF